jgi:hypothetical protein
MGSCRIRSVVPHGLTGWVILSAGVNDAGVCSAQVRDLVGDAAKVIWIIPPERYGLARDRMLSAGQAHYGDKFVVYAPGKDGLHPRSYSELVRAIEATKR